MNLTTSERGQLQRNEMALWQRTLMTESALDDFETYTRTVLLTLFWNDITGPGAYRLIMQAFATYEHDMEHVRDTYEEALRKVEF